MNDIAIEIEEKLSSLIDDKDFIAVDDRMARFNVFEAMGAVRGELRHSNFLAFLLSPTRAHGLGSVPLQRVLRAVLARMQPNQRPVRPLQLVVGDLDGAIVYRERDSIDLLIEIKALNLVVLIENKIGAKAGEGQLAKYKSLLAARYPTERRLLVFLTPDGAEPDEDGYVAFDYLEIAKILDRLVDDANEETALIVRHYTEMLRRNVVPDEALRDLARQLYQRHKEAFDFVFDSRPTQDGLIESARTFVRATPGIVEDYQQATVVRFIPQSWEGVSELSTCPPTSWTKTGRTAIFEIKTYSGSDRINLALVVGPANVQVRDALYNGARDQLETFVGLVKPMGKQFATIYSRDLLTAAAAENMDTGQKVEAVKAGWNRFVQRDMLKIEEAVKRFASGAPA